MTNAHPYNPLRAAPPLPAGAVGKAAFPCPIPSSPAFGEEGDEDLGAEAGSHWRGPRQSALPRSRSKTKKKIPEIRRFPPPPLQIPAKPAPGSYARLKTPPLISRAPARPFSRPGCHPELGKRDSGNASQRSTTGPGESPAASSAGWPRSLGCFGFIGFIFLHVIARCMSQGGESAMGRVVG